jgi:sterol desaturase/sphingolipid hydroxylase (fatty acid hydroxylase superfamily)
VPLGSLALAAATTAVVWIGVGALQRSGGVAAGLGAGRAELLAPPVLLVIGVSMIAERLWPAEPRPFLARGHLHDAAYFVLHVTVVVALMTLFSVAFASLLEHRAGWLAAPWTARLPAGLVVGLTLVLMDGANWAAHWTDHRVNALWRLHALHHSQEELSVLTSFRAHPLSHLPGFLLASIPAFVLTGHRGLAPQLVIAYVCLGTVPHANVRWTYGPLGRVFVSPSYHRLHHAVDGAAGTNLGVVLTVWDVLAGRARFPDRTRPAARTGLAGRPVPVEQGLIAPSPLWLLAQQLCDPFRPVPAAERS